MRVLVYPHLMEIGGSQLNAVELAAAVARRGHEVVLFGPRGALVPVAERLGLEFVASPREHAWPTLANAVRLRQLVGERGLDVVHGYEWGPSLDLAFGVEAVVSTPAVTTVLSMSVPDFLPRHSPLVVGTAALHVQQAARRRGPTRLMEPPIDTDTNAPGDVAASRRRLGLGPGELVVSIVCRMTTDLDKVEGVVTAVRLVERLAASGLDVRLLVVGDGDGLSRVRRTAAEVNAAVGRAAVVVTGALLDPADAYNASDVVLGMGSSALKGLAFAKPLVVQGAHGFWRRLDEATLDGFLQEGWYGDGGRGADDLEEALRPLLADAGLRQRSGALARDLVLRRYSLGAAAACLEEIYADALARPPDRHLVLRELARTSREFAKFRVVRFGQEHVQPMLAGAGSGKP